MLFYNKNSLKNISLEPHVFYGKSNDKRKKLEEKKEIFSNPGAVVESETDVDIARIGVEAIHSA